MAPKVFWGTGYVPGARAPATGGQPDALILMGDWRAVWPRNHETKKTRARDATLHRAQSGNLMTPDGRSGWETEYVLAPGRLMGDPFTDPLTLDPLTLDPFTLSASVGCSRGNCPPECRPAPA